MEYRADFKARDVEFKFVRFAFEKPLDSFAELRNIMA